MNLIFIGAPGSGKGTQASKFVAEKSFQHVSTGDLLRSEIAKKSELGLKVKSIMDNGQLVSDDVVLELIKANVDLSKGSYIFDGYPRNIEQAKTLDDRILNKHAYKAVYFKVNKDEIVKRLTNRRVSADGKHIYNLITKPPKIDGVCDITGSKLIQREDDKEEVIRKRLQVFEDTVGPMLEYYKSNGNLLELDASMAVENIYKKICDNS